eukprot:243634-Prorocentrum_minimum.AAC.1
MRAQRRPPQGPPPGRASRGGEYSSRGGEYSSRGGEYSSRGRIFGAKYTHLEPALEGGRVQKAAIQ